MPSPFSACFLARTHTAASLAVSIWLGGGSMIPSSSAIHVESLTGGKSKIWRWRCSTRKRTRKRCCDPIVKASTQSKHASQSQGSLAYASLASAVFGGPVCVGGTVGGLHGVPTPLPAAAARGGRRRLRRRSRTVTTSTACNLHNARQWKDRGTGVVLERADCRGRVKVEECGQ